MIRTPLAALLALVSSLAGCASSAAAAIPLVRARAAKDLLCPDEDIRIVDELGGRYKALGCGRKARYRAACEGVSCVVRSEDEPAIPWKDRPDPIGAPP